MISSIFGVSTLRLTLTIWVDSIVSSDHSIFTVILETSFATKREEERDKKVVSLECCLNNENCEEPKGKTHVLHDRQEPDWAPIPTLCPTWTCLTFFPTLVAFPTISWLFQERDRKWEGQTSKISSRLASLPRDTYPTQIGYLAGPQPEDAVWLSEAQL